MSTAVVGGWSSFNFEITSEQRKVFDQAVGGLLGVKYTPLAVATQVVAGTNYCYLCKAQPVYPKAQEYAAEVFIYQPLQGDPHVTQIKRLEP
jgi:hypothetical protein